MTVRYSQQEVVWIVVRHKKDQDPLVENVLSNPDDPSLVKRLLKFMTSEKIIQIIPVGNFGPNEFCGGFAKIDATKITNWLKGQGCVLD